MKFLSNHILILKQLLHQLGLRPFEGNSENILLNKAAKWALNDASFEIKEYTVTALQPVLETLKKGQSTQYVIPKLLSVDLSMPTDSKPVDLQKYFIEFKTALAHAKNEQLLTVLEIWASSIAVNDKFNDLSLYDFIRTTVGITSCLNKENGKLRLLGGTISGIQSYLYEIISKNAAKLLKGRSFYVQLLTDSLLDEVLNAFDLSICHVVYSSGGGFYILIPDTEGVESKFDDFRNNIAKKIYKEHKTALFAELAITEPFDTSKQVNAIWDDLFTELGKLKYKRLHNNSDFVNDFFDFIEIGGTKSEDRDPITNEEIKDTDEIDTLFDVKMLKITKQQIELGKDLRGANYWISSKRKIENKTETIKDPLGKFHYLERQIPKGDLSNASIIALNETNSHFPFIFYGGNDFPFNPETGYAKGFDELIENDNFKRLAIVRMDVDGLGTIFSGDIGTGKYMLNWVRYVSVSRSLDQFFKGYLNTLQKPYKDNSVIIYSGGDDLFIVGKWDSIISLSETIHAEFKKWSCNNLTLSGGIVLLPNKFPVMQGARLADEVEKKAKNHEFKIDTEKEPFKKNAITLFDVSLNWDTEFVIVKSLYERLCPFIMPKDRRIDKSFLSKINAHAERQSLYEKTQKELTDAKKEGRLPKPYLKEFSPAWRWTMAYDMARFKERVRDPDAKRFIEEMTTACFVNRIGDKPLKSKYSFLTLLQLAARWVEFEYRAKNNDD